MKLVAMLRVKDQILTIKECLTKLSELVDAIVIVDNGSIDGTLNIYKEFPKIKIIKKTKGFNEGRDKCLAHKCAKKLQPDWIVWLDGDEIFEKKATRQDLDRYIENPEINLVRFRMFNFWLSRNKFRVDGIWSRYNAFPQRQMWRNLPEAYFRNIPFHNGGIMGVKGRTITSIIRIKHYGYISKRQIENKIKTYAKLKKDAMSKKTLPASIQGMKRVKWLESSQRTINKAIQIGYWLYWGIAEQCYILSKTLTSFFKINFKS